MHGGKAGQGTAGQGYLGNTPAVAADKHGNTAMNMTSNDL